MSSLHLIRTLEEASLNAWPARHHRLDEGWLLRFHGGYTRRANSVNPIYAVPEAAWLTDDEALALRVERCHDLYRAQGLPTVFKITPLAQPPHLDAFLRQAGYRFEAPTSVQTLPLRDLAPAERLEASVVVERQTSLTDRWLEHFARFSALTAASTELLRGILEGILAHPCFMLLVEEGEPVACGLAVRQGELVGLFDIVTAPATRGRGLGKRLLRQLLAWGRTGGATTAYLQVMDDNAPARRLYARLGFGERYRYWYRVTG